MANAPIQLKKVTPGDVVAVQTGYVGFVAGSDGKFYAKDGSGAAAEIGATNETEVQQLIDDSLEGLGAIEIETKSATSGGTWGPRDGAKLMFLGDTAYLIGGWAGANYDSDWDTDSTTNQVFRSTDFGVTWTRIRNHDATPDATHFSLRHWLAALVHEVDGTEYMYMLNGDVGDVNQGPKNSDVRRSTDGITWTKVNSVTPGYDGKILMIPGSLNGNLYLVGGQADLTAATATNEVWRSTDDGVTWSSLGNAPWTARFGPDQLVNHDGKLWLIGGGRYDETPDNRVFYNDVWTFDGTTWTEVLPDGHTEFPGKIYHNAFSYDGWIYILRGASRIDGIIRGNTSLCYRSRDGVKWERVDLGLVDSHADGVGVHSTGFLVASGNAYLQGAPSNTDSPSIFISHNSNYADGIVQQSRYAGVSAIESYTFDTFQIGCTDGTSPPSLTPGTNDKFSTLTMPHRIGTEENITLIGGYSFSTGNTVYIGGGVLSSQNAATQIRFFLGSTTSSTVGDQKGLLESNGLRLTDRLQIGLGNLPILTGFALNAYGCHWLVGATESTSGQVRTGNTAKQFSLGVPRYAASTNDDRFLVLHAYATDSIHVVDYGWGIAGQKSVTLHRWYVGSNVSSTSPTEMARLDSTTSATESGLLLRIDGSLRRVKLGAVGTGPGGSGRMLYMD